MKTGVKLMIKFVGCLVLFFMSNKYTFPRNDVFEKSLIDVEVNYTTSIKSDKYVLSLFVLKNLAGADSIKKVRLKIHVGDEVLRYHQLESMALGQCVFFIDSIDKSWSNPYYIVEYELKNKKQKLINAIIIPSRPSDVSSLVNFLPVLSSLLGAVLGASLVHFFSKKRESTRSQFEWNKMLFEKYESGYRQFIKNWDCSISPSILERQFRFLQENIIVPFSVRKSYSQTITKLLDSQSTDVEKQEQCEKLLLAIENVINSSEN